jgi:LacI family transcriptional regulator
MNSLSKTFATSIRDILADEDVLEALLTASEESDEATPREPFPSSKDLPCASVKPIELKTIGICLWGVRPEATVRKKEWIGSPGAIRDLELPAAPMLLSCAPEQSEQEEKQERASGFLAAALLRGIRAVADDENVNLRLLPAPRKETGQAEVFFEQPLAGVILASGRHDDLPETLAIRGLPIITVARNRQGSSHCSSLVPDTAALMDTALRHLLGLGHQRIAFLCGPVIADDTTEQRNTPTALLAQAGNSRNDLPRCFLEQFACVLGEHNLFAPSLVRFSPYEATLEQIRAIVSEWMQLQEPPSAIFCNDSHAVGQLLAALAHEGRRVPEDVSVLSLDDERGTVGRAYPNLTCVEFPAQQMGRDALHVLLSLLQQGASSDERSSPIHHPALTTPARLILRGSTGSFRKPIYP